MPGFVRSILIKITSYGWLVALLGLGLAGFAAYSQYKATDNHAFIAQDKLSSLSGKVETATEITVTKKRRRGGSHVSERYYEIDVKPADGEAQKLRISFSVKREVVEEVIEEQITALYDPADDNIVYDIKMGDKTVLAYADTRARLQAQAEATAKSMGGLGSYAIYLVLVVLGVVATVFNRKLRKAEEAAA